MSEIDMSGEETPEDIKQFVEANKYPIPEKGDPRRYMSRCIDERYPSEKDLPALAIPGADIGQIVMIFAALNVQRKEIDLDKVFNALIEVVGGVENVRIHTDSKHPEGIAEGCGYFAEVVENPKAFGITKEQVAIIKGRFDMLLKQGAKQVVLEGKHKKEGIIIPNGEYSIYPGGRFFVYHKSLVEERNRKLADVLFDRKEQMIQNHIFGDLLNKTSSNHLSEIKSRLAPKIPEYPLHTGSVTPGVA